MEVSLNSEQEAFIASRIESGRFGSADEVVQTALALLQERENRSAATLPAEKLDLVQLFRESPFHCLDIEFPRDKGPLRPIDL